MAPADATKKILPGSDASLMSAVLWTGLEKGWKKINNRQNEAKLAELWCGVEKRQQVEKNREALNDFILPLEVADFDQKAAESYGKVRALLEKEGKPIASMGMMIGAHALSVGVTLVTNNTREFRRIKNLKFVDWTN